MGRKKGRVNNLTLNNCPVCGQPALLKTVRSMCPECKKKKHNKYHREYMQKKYYDKE